MQYLIPDAVWYLLPYICLSVGLVLFWLTSHANVNPPPSALRHLDVSFCRGISEAALGLVADACVNLTSLTVFGCSHVGRKFLYGHSNPVLREVVGTGTLTFDS